MGEIGQLQPLIVVANSHFVPLADTHEHRRMPNTETAHQLYMLSLIIK